LENGDKFPGEQNRNEILPQIQEDYEIEGNNMETSKKTHNYNLGPSRNIDYRFSFVSVNAGLEKWGDRAENALEEELKLFIKERVFENIISPTDEHIKKAFRMHCLITEKHDGRIKARAVADGRTQTRYLEEETYSPTVCLESIMLSSLIDAVEKRHVRVIDIKGAFLKTRVPNDMELFVKMEGELARMMNRLQPEFQIHDDGFMYLKCIKALYGHIEAARFSMMS